MTKVYKKYLEANARWRKTDKCKSYQRAYQQKIRKNNIKLRLKYIWYGIKHRCLNTKNPAYVNYGGRGIKICSQWENSFESFYNDVGRKYLPGLTLERINNNGDYNKKNCKWIPKGEQALNRRNNKNNKIYA